MLVERWEVEAAWDCFPGELRGLQHVLCLSHLVKSMRNTLMVGKALCWALEERQQGVGERPGPEAAPRRDSFLSRLHGTADKSMRGKRAHVWLEGWRDQGRLPGGGGGGGDEIAGARTRILGSASQFS